MPSPVVPSSDIAISSNDFIEFVFSPDAWKKVSNSSHTWNEVEFPPVPKDALPTKPGVYIFVVHQELFKFVHSSGLFYIGKAANLRSRMYTYIRELNTEFKLSKRPRVWRMINQWDGHLKIHYTTTEDVAKAEALEESMLTAFIPPFNTQFPATISSTMRAFR